jgi:hypothetical protein
MKIGRPATFVVGVAAVVALSLLGSMPLASAHDSWISRHQFRDPASNAWCCDEHDCGALGDGRVRETTEGYIVDNRFAVTSSRVLPSYDGHFWACFEPGGLHGHGPKRGIRCFFAPLMSEIPTRETGPMA